MAGADVPDGTAAGAQEDAVSLCAMPADEAHAREQGTVADAGGAKEGAFSNDEVIAAEDALHFLTTGGLGYLGAMFRGERQVQSANAQR